MTIQDNNYVNRAFVFNSLAPNHQKRFPRAGLNFHFYDARHFDDNSFISDNIKTSSYQDR